MTSDPLLPNPSKVFVGNLPVGYSEQELRNYFSKVGVISKLELKQRFCFIEYEEVSQAEAAHKELDNSEFLGQTISVQPHDPLIRQREYINNVAKPQYTRPLPPDGRGPPRKHFRVCVFNLDENASWRDLKDYGRQIGEVNYSAVFHYQGEKVGVVEYLTPEEMNKALDEIPNLPFLGKTIRVEEDIGQLDKELAAANGYGPKRRSPSYYGHGPHMNGPYPPRRNNRYPSPPRGYDSRRDSQYDRRDRFPPPSGPYDDRRRGYDRNYPPRNDDHYRYNEQPIHDRRDRYHQQSPPEDRYSRQPPIDNRYGRYPPPSNQYNRRSPSPPRDYKPPRSSHIDDDRRNNDYFYNGNNYYQSRDDRGDCHRQTR